MALVRSELLCYTFCNIHRCCANALITCLIDFYKPGEIALARDLLWTTYESLLNDMNVKKARRSPQPANTAAAKLYAQDIAGWALSIANEHPDDLHTAFVAVDLNNVPPCPPEEVNIFSIVTRVNALEKEMKSNASSVASLQLRMEQQDQCMSPLPLQQKEQRQPQQSQVHKAGSSIWDVNPSPVPGHSTKPKQRTGGSTSWAAVAEKDSAQWKQVVRKRRHQIRVASKGARQVIGRASADTEVKVKASKPAFHLFVHKVDASVSTDDMTKLLNDANIRARSIRMTSKEDWPSRSFKITVDKDDAEKVFSPDIWPAGVRCREWISPSAARNARNCGKDSSANPGSDASHESDSNDCDGESGDGQHVVDSASQY